MAIPAYPPVVGCTPVHGNPSPADPVHQFERRFTSAKRTFIPAALEVDTIVGSAALKPMKTGFVSLDSGYILMMDPMMVVALGLPLWMVFRSMYMSVIISERVCFCMISLVPK